MEVDRDTLAEIHQYVWKAESKTQRWKHTNKAVATLILEDLKKALDLFDIMLGGM
jgi:hypothetical protein